jgi:hypothetical protein
LTAAYDLDFNRHISKPMISSFSGTSCNITQEKSQNCNSPYLSIIY